MNCYEDVFTCIQTRTTKTFLTKYNYIYDEESLLLDMESTNLQADWEKDIVKTEWEDEDTDAVVQYQIDTEFLHLEDVDELD